MFNSDMIFIRRIIICFLNLSLITIICFLNLSLITIICFLNLSYYNSHVIYKNKCRLKFYRIKYLVQGDSNKMMKISSNSI